MEVPSSVMVTTARDTAAGPVGSEAAPEGLKTSSVSSGSLTPSAAAVSLKTPSPEVIPAGMVTAKSSTAPKSPGPAVPAATDTGTDTAEAGRAGCPAPPNPVSAAVTVTSVSPAPSVTAVGLTLRTMRLSPSRMVRSAPNTSLPADVPDRRRVSGPSNPASSAAVIDALADPDRRPAGMAAVKSSTAVKSAAWAVPAATDTVTAAAPAGRSGCPSPP